MNQPAIPNRTMIFVSHANPEENEFARWITLRLANEGYPVWCDQTKLLGGEKFWEDIEDAIKNRTVKFLFVLTRAESLKLYRKGDNPILRGTAYVSTPQQAFLWTRGWTPRLRTYPGMEVPNPLSVEITKGVGDMEVVLADILSLTKLNYNTCRYGDGKPITLKFADAVGDVLTAGPTATGNAPLPFQYYI